MMNRYVAILFAHFIAGAVFAHAQARRPMTVDDLFGIRTMTDVRMSPDGTLIAVVIQRAWSDPETYRPYTMFGNDQADIWIVPAAGGAPKNITNGASDGSGYWNPVWSPDGERLALLSTAGNDNVRAYVWEKRSGQVARVSERGVDTLMRTNATDDPNPLQWVDRSRLLVTVLPDGEQSTYFRLRRQTRRIATEAWDKLARGREPTSSVLEGGVMLAPAPPDQLLLVDVTTRRTDVLVEGPIKYVLVSPDRRQAAVVMQQRRPPPRSGSLLRSAYVPPSRLGLVSLQSGSTVRWIDAAFNPAVEFGTFRHRWSPEGSLIAIIGRATAELDAPRATFIVSATDGAVRQVAQGLEVATLTWSEPDRLVVRARRSQTDRWDWFTIPPQGDPRNLTSALTTTPVALMRTESANELIGLVDATLWRLDAATGESRAIDTGGNRLRSVLWPSAEDRATGAVASIMARSADGSVVRIDLSGATNVTTIPLPTQATRIAAYDRQRSFIVASAPDDPGGTFLWTRRGDTTNFVRRLALNEQLAGIAGSDPRIIDYRSTTGQALKAILFLPPGYEQGRRYPLVTWVYPGTVIQDLSSESFWSIKNHAHYDNLHVMTGHGYAVLVPSVPTSVNLDARELKELTVGVLPAVDRAVELGVADSNRVGLIGQSGGGYVTYGLVTQTNRFRAAVAISGPVNHLTSYGVFSGEARYRDDLDVVSSGSQAPFGEPPWVNPRVYVESSPLSYLDRVETPLLILHGDIDYIPIQHAEEVFTSLARMGKRVRFVRYWGESHGVGDSPANIRDRWQQIFRWFDTYLRSAQ